MTREELEKRKDEFAPLYAETLDEEVKREILAVEFTTSPTDTTTLR
jgi:hypothetical protein